MSAVSTPIRAFTPRKRLETDRLETLRAKIVKESSNLYKLPTTSPTRTSIPKLNNIPISSPSLKQEELNREHVKVARRSKLGLGGKSNDTLPAIEWEHPELIKIEKRTINKELETKRVLINILLLLSSKLVYNFLELILKKLIDLNVEINFNFKNLLYGFQLLFLWNIVNGLYKVLKPQDQFTDLSLTPHQRELLGLPQVPITTTSDLPVVKNRLIKNIPESTKVEPVEHSEVKTSPENVKRINTPIASPMASPSKSFSPRKIQSPTKQQSTSVQPKSLTTLKKQEITSTPTYIPSPKYYYRMDSPSRTRRRPL